jgi:biotin-(acetyl-CoA carboxylase) ligase
MQIERNYNWSKQKVRLTARTRQERDTKPRLPMLTDADIRLPPPFRLVTLREVGDAFAHAKTNAAEEGAGTLVFVGRFDLAEFAVVLEPDEPLKVARRTFYACMAALADTLSAQAPPETDIAIGWPDAVSVNLGLVGGGQMAWPDDANEDEPPAWLVFGAMVRLVSMTGTDAGLHPLSAALEDEGFDESGAERLMESYARHLMVMLDAWQEQGFAAAAKSYLQRLAPEKEKGIRRDIDENGDLLLRRMGKVEVERRALIPALATPSWLDPATRGPRL